MKQKGFTLLEVLAVITILGLVITILTPVVTGSLKQGKKDLAITSTKNYVEACETYLKAAALKNNLTKLEPNKTYQVAKETTIGLKKYKPINDLIEFSGEIPTEGTITTNDNYALSSATLKIGGYTVIYDGETKEASIKS